VTDAQELRIQAWKDTLSSAELEEVERVHDMPVGMAIGYVLVKLSRDIEELRQPMWKSALRTAGVFAGGVGAAVVAVLNGELKP
jgi:hypothetical protein